MATENEIKDRIIANGIEGLRHVIAEKEAAVADARRLRAALEEIAALEEVAPAWNPSVDEQAHGRADGRYEAAEMARAALVKP